MYPDIIRPIPVIGCIGGPVSQISANKLHQTMYSKLATMYGCTPLSQALINQNDKNEKLMVDETICLAPNKT